MKRSLLSRLFSAFLAWLVLTASVGLTVQRHTCRQSGHTTAGLIFSAPRHGCPAPRQAAHQTGAKLQAACCDFSAHFHQLDTPAPDHLAAPAPSAPLPAVLPAPFSWPTRSGEPARAAGVATWHATDASPPPRAGRALLTFVCTLVV